MKYRIKEENNGFDTFYYPQYKWLLFWHTFTDCWMDDIWFYTLERAEGWLKKRITKTTIKIHEI